MPLLPQVLARHLASLPEIANQETLPREAPLYAQDLTARQEQHPFLTTFALRLRDGHGMTPRKSLKRPDVICRIRFPSRENGAKFVPRRAVPGSNAVKPGDKRSRRFSNRIGNAAQTRRESFLPQR